MSFHDGLLDAIAFPPDWQVFTPESVVLLFALLAPLVSLWDADRRGMRQFALIGIGGALLLTIGTLLPGPQGTTGFVLGRFSLQYIEWSAQSAAAGHPVAEIFRVTYASQLFKALFLGVAFLAVLGIGRPIKGKAEEDFGEFCSLILFATLGMMVVASARELVTLVLGIEMASMSSYLMAGFRRDTVGAEASLKYFTIGAISSGMLLFGVSLVYGLTGSTRLPEVAAAFSAGSFGGITAVPIIMLLAGLGFKVSSVPFHAWAPDVYAGAPAPVAGILASASKAMGFVAVFQVFLVGLIGIKADWQLAVAALAAVSMTVGNLVALQQTNVRRMLAFSSIAQAGYVLVAVAVAGALGGASAGGDSALSATYAVGGGIFHLLTNAAMKLGAFLVIGALLFAGLPDHLEGWRGLGRRQPILAGAMAIFLLSMAGLPPLGGFASKFVLFSSAIDAGITQQLGWLVWLAAFAVANSAVSLYYYLRVLRAMYVEEGDEGRIRVPGEVVGAVVICAALVLAMGLAPQWFMDASFKAAAGLLAGT